MLNYFGNGQHYYAWIHEKDVVDMFCHALTNSSVRGVYNAVAPNPIPQKKMLVELKEGFIQGTNHASCANLCPANRA